ncbi:NTP transferase domain-containing protein [Alphaproteobacteria bacterium GH1-50]|uniref:NTP transferase domain-containing protein n=1 Tax=Kangsaoukella pontilimi TaxID=2691042 RepID=A0A7C9IF02_9RHOB|nr:nucleotidyltransferase family protein [Kangsaoukella pontilimi]MXQ07184.1 NTP transferase domain-containing protein [Kangsaoukella pontilimi]
MSVPFLIIPAAGAASRMRGGDKLLEKIDGMPLLRRQAQAALGAGTAPMVLLREEDTARREALMGLRVVIETVSDAWKGMSATLRHGAVRAAGRPLALLLPDVPGVTSAEIRAVLDAFDGTHVTRATDPEGRPGTPIVFPPRLLDGFAFLKGDDGGRSLLIGEEITLVPFEDDRATRDLDTPEDWRRWRAETGR